MLFRSPPAVLSAAVTSSAGHIAPRCIAPGLTERDPDVETAGLRTDVRWGFVFLACPLPLTEEQRLELVKLAAQAWFDDLPEIRFDWEGCEGVVRPAADVVSLGTFTGQRFLAEVNLKDRSGKLDFLVAEAHLGARGGIAEA